MRILSIGNMYPPHHLGGYELTWRSAVQHLREHGHGVRVLTTDYRASQPDPDVPEDPAVRRELRWYWHDHRFPRSGPRARFRLERDNLRLLLDELSSSKPDLLQWWGMGGMSMSLVEAVRRLGIPAMGVVGEDWMVYGPRVDGWHRMVNRRLMPTALIERVSSIPSRLDLRTGAFWLFNSEVTREHAERAHGPFPHAGVAHPGIDTRLFTSRPEHDWSWRLLYVGRLDRRKGIETAVRSLVELPDAALTIVGDGDPAYERSLTEIVRRHRLESRVHFRRCARGELGDVYAAADAVVFPVLWEEPWGLVPLEAMAVGVPVIATGSGGSAEYLRDGVNSLIFTPRNSPSALADAVERLAGDDDLRTRLRTEGFKTAAMFTEAAYNEAILQAIEAAA